MTNKCLVEKCDKTAYLRNLCIKHYTRLRRNGDVSLNKKSFEYRKINIFKKIAITADPNKCWEWQGSVWKLGYGKQTWDNKNRMAHRIVWFLIKGQHPAGCLLHSCDNKLCVNPNHLHVGDHKQNMAEMVQRNRQAKGETNAHSIFTEAEVLRIRQLKKEGKTFKQLAEQYQCGNTTIQYIVYRKSWRHI